eukprot:3377264-Alexandrium_andersonii.AAC.1
MGGGPWLHGAAREREGCWQGQSTGDLVRCRGGHAAGSQGQGGAGPPRRRPIGHPLQHTAPRSRA